MGQIFPTTRATHKQSLRTTFTQPRSTDTKPKPVLTLHEKLLALPGETQNIIYDYINAYDPPNTTTAIIDLDTKISDVYIDVIVSYPWVVFSFREDFLSPPLYVSKMWSFRAGTDVDSCGRNVLVGLLLFMLRMLFLVLKVGLILVGFGDLMVWMERGGGVRWRRL